MFNNYGLCFLSVFSLKPNRGVYTYGILIMWFTVDIHMDAQEIGGEGKSNSLQYSCLENPMDGGAW